MSGEVPEREGFEFIQFTGSISTLDGDEEWDVPEREFPFGFCYQPAPPPRPEIVDPPTLSSFAWARWLS